MSACDLEVVDYWLEKYPENLDLRFTKEFIFKDGIKPMLKSNILFCFIDTYFKQEKGTAVGTKFAPVYTTLTIGCLEENRRKYRGSFMSDPLVADIKDLT